MTRLCWPRQIPVVDYLMLPRRGLRNGALRICQLSCWVPLGLLVACGTANPDTNTGEEAMSQGGEQEEAPLRPPARPPVLAEGTTAADAVCERGASEVCNAIDDDCDHRIDEGNCGYQSGPIQITVAWNSGADIDLYVLEPGGETVSAQQRRSETGAHLDHDGRGNCTEGQQHRRVENLRWEGRPPAGEYTVELHYLFECETNAGPTTATTSLTVAEQRIGTYNYTLTPNERVRVLKFELP